MIKTLRAFDLRGKNVLLRADFNVPIYKDQVTNNFRIKAVLPTILTCIEAGAGVVIMSHMGRPHGTIDSNLSLIAVGEELASLLEMPIKFSDNCVSTDSIDTSISLKQGEVHLLENLRFHSGEQNNETEFSSKLARHGQIYINDAFGTAHRSHSSNVGVVEFFKNAGIGWLMDRELNYFSDIMTRPQSPLTVLLGGAKVDTKIKLIENFLRSANNIIIGGGMAFTFLKALGKNVGGSLVDETKIDIARNIIAKARSEGVKILLPSDVICSSSSNGTNNVGPKPINQIGNDLMGLDIGPNSVLEFTKTLDSSKTVLWNGPMGVFEKPGFDYGSRKIAESLAKSVEVGNKVIVGGGDTAAAVDYFGLSGKMTHISTGGGASLELLSGNNLPALSILEI